MTVVLKEGPTVEFS